MTQPLTPQQTEQIAALQWGEIDMGGWKIHSFRGKLGEFPRFIIGDDRAELEQQAEAMARGVA